MAEASAQEPAGQERWTAIDRYIADLLVAPDPVLDATLEANAAAGLPAIDVSPTQGKQLSLLAGAIRARRILEIGTLGGYSTIWLARAIPAGGCLVTLEIDPGYASVAKGNLANAGLADLVDVRVGLALETLSQLVAEDQEPFDLIFIDADKRSTPEYFEWALQLSRPGSLIIADNVVRDGAVLDPSSNDPSVVGVRRFYELAAAEPRVSATAIQTVGSKGHDGFAIALVTD